MLPLFKINDHEMKTENSRNLNNYTGIFKIHYHPSLGCPKRHFQYIYVAIQSYVHAHLD